MSEKRVWLIELRKIKGLTQTEVAKSCEISRSYYTLIENGSRTPTVSIAKLLGKELDFNWKSIY
ncbi:helix-turn-helix transcriptional regulator [Heyndrickxia oleronia]|uniref:Helix-turn-helix transcriptional regulator n=1 Tax=Heyndrickxia oleronia TaxID=38875 RepID=A0AAW6T1Y9_9BACI|nr:helix-turn-helix transcriptional regulator [Heyndrickxia oleronia]NYV66546.1 helix-turn-helix transcriptional regulator [Bacillus sp. Gen3]MCM3240689.1 helix-turn-helix transcriptional regulator [Heyndrickxia oleronia]MCM3454890.1 helix-turn-helix transcriptional regulator [Heyndrickxia oleronia]MDH5163362.1 helix-turn-helix transcriptional regulator [Heyndrickxia oleronia]GIN41399.1 hypothetical protein J19TS1_43480 [Heyndrickxia oleronia]